MFVFLFNFRRVVYFLEFCQQEHSQVELELRVLEALEIYPPFKLQGLLLLFLALITPPSGCRVDCFVLCDAEYFHPFFYGQFIWEGKGFKF